MPFESVRFLLFLLPALSVFWALRRSRQAQKLFLIAASAWFYGTYGWEFVGLLALSIARQSSGGRPRRREHGVAAQALARRRGGG